MQRRVFLGLCGLGTLAGCGTSRVPPPPAITGVPGHGPYEAWSCVPYARQRSGISLAGDAWQWWEAAAGRYARARRPEPGSVLVLARTPRLSSGHLSVVRRIVSAREIRVDHANWASGALRGRVAEDQPVLDVSPGSDWSQVRVWYPRIDALGNTVFPAHGFILPRTVVAGR